MRSSDFRLLAIAALGTCLLISGCASVTHKPATGSSKDDGIPYYETSPYLLIYAAPNGGLATDLLYLPDPYKKQVVMPKNFAASVTLNLTFDRGVLNQ